MKSIYKMLLLVNIAFSVCFANVKAQEGQASGKKKQLTTDASLMNLVDEQGQQVAVGGITVKNGGAISLGPAIKNAGFWSSINGKKYHVRFWDQRGISTATIEIQGLVRWDKNGNVIDGKENFLRIKTTDDPNNFIEITNRTVNEDGELIISTLNGPQFKITALSMNFDGTIVIVPSLRYFYKSKPMTVGVIIVVLAIVALGFAVWYRGRMKPTTIRHLEQKEGDGTSPNHS